MQKDLKQIEKDCQESSTIGSSVFIYKRVLADESTKYPADFWNKDVETKAKQLLKYYMEEKDIEVKQVPYRDIPELVKKARLQKPVEKAYSGNPYIMVEEVLENLSVSDLQWNIHPEATPEEVEKLRKQYRCNWAAIGRYFNKKTRELKKMVDSKTRSKEIDIIEAPVLEVCKFWHHVNQLKKGKITIEDLLDKMQECRWNKDTTNKYLCRYGVKEEVGRYNSQMKRKTKLENHDKELNSAEALVAEKLEGQIHRIKGYGADFLHQEKEIIEVKKSLSKYNIRHAILQLTYARELLDNQKDLKIYTKNYKIPEKRYCCYKKYIKHYNIEIYEYNSSKGEFELIKS